MNSAVPDAPATKEAGGNIPIPRLVKQKIKDGMVALAMATWCFGRSWSYLLFDGNRYFDIPVVRPVELLALGANILGAAVLLWLGIRLWRRCQARMPSLWLELLFLSLLAFPADFVRGQILDIKDTQMLVWVKNPAVILCLAAVAIIVIWKHRLAARTVALLVAITFPMTLLVLTQIVLVCANVIHVNGCPPALPPPLLPVQEGRPRVVWIIFDETDYRMAFVQRPASLALPEFDRLRQAALSADHAYAPGDGTILSMPALISGHRLSGVSRNGCDLALRLAGTHATNDWTKMPSVFSQARELGVNTALVGWYIPYARLLGSSLNYCSWYPMPNYQSVNSPTFLGSLQQELAALAWPLRGRQIFINICRDSLKDSISVADDPRYGLILLHLPPPHTPGVYLPAKNQFTCMVMPKAAGYFNNLALADSELGALRRDMEKSGQWDKTWVILSADHSWRISKIYDGVRDYRVPFLVKPPQASQSLTYSNPINTVLTHDLILAILRNQVTNQPSTAAWLDLHATTDLPVIQPDAPFE